MGTKLLNEYEKIFNEYVNKNDSLYERVKKSIKHPHFYYAVVELDGSITYKRKKWWKWFSGKRIVTVKIAKRS